MFIFITLFIFNMPSVMAYEKEQVTLSKCVDGDTAWFIRDGEKIKTRFIAIDTPESTNKIEAYGKEASDFTCDLLTNSSFIEIEYEEDSDKTDKYDRHLVWVFVDGELLQEKVIENGLAEVAYLYGDYKYTDVLEDAEEIAKKKKLGIWNNTQDNNDVNYNYFIIGIVLILIICIFSKKGRKKVISKTKSTIKKEMKKFYKNL